jgi:hypothetical protein
MMGKKGPIDVRNMPGSGVDIALYDNARQMKDAGRVGQGFQFGEGDNKNFSAQLKEESGLERDLNAAGQLETAVGQKLGGMFGGLQQSANFTQDQRNFQAQAWSSMYGNHRGTKKPSIWERLLLGGVSAAGAAAGAGGGAG